LIFQIFAQRDIFWLKIAYIKDMIFSLVRFLVL